METTEWGVFLSPPFMQNIGSVISEYRRKAQISQKELAEKIGTNATFLSAIEHGHRKPTLAFLERVSFVLKTPVEIFLWDSVETKDIPLEDRRTVELAKTLVRHYLLAKHPRPTR